MKMIRFIKTSHIFTKITPKTHLCGKIIDMVMDGTQGHGWDILHMLSYL